MDALRLGLQCLLVITVIMRMAQHNCANYILLAQLYASWIARICMSRVCECPRNVNIISGRLLRFRTKGSIKKDYGLVNVIVACTTP